MGLLEPLLRANNSIYLQPFQSHFGAIGTKDGSLEVKTDKNISIPLWGYWNFFRITNPIIIKNHFNPTLGLLEHLLWAPGEDVKLRFQSHFGAIGTLYFDVILTKVFVISIPLWGYWNNKPMKKEKKVKKDFNPTLGLLELIPSELEERTETVISIPLWGYWNQKIQM